MDQSSLLLKLRNEYTPKLPEILTYLKEISFEKSEKSTPLDHLDEIKEYFPNTYGLPYLQLQKKKPPQRKTIKVGVVLSGGQAAGGHNVIIGIHHALLQLVEECVFYGFLGGPSGILEGKYKELIYENLAHFKNTGGFDLIGSGRTKIETEKQLQQALDTCTKMQLDGLVIIGGDDSNTNAAVLAEYFLQHQSDIKVIGVPKTIDGDLKNEHLAVSFGFDTACKTYSEMIGNICRDALSAKKYYHFIKLMGRSASHIALECALQTHPNLTLIGEEIAEKKTTLEALTVEIADLIEKRAEQEKNYGVILIPEGVIEFIPEIKKLISELNQLLSNSSNPGEVQENLSQEGRKTFTFLPEKIQEQLLLDRDPHGNVQVSKIQTESLFIETLQKELKKRGEKAPKLNAVSHFFGYEGRAAFPSNFDASYCYALGYCASLLLISGFTGYMASIKNLSQKPKDWLLFGIPITSLMNLEERKGKKKPVIKKTLVDLKGLPFQSFAKQRKDWMLRNQYHFPGPIQFFGPEELANTITHTLFLEQE